MTSKAHITAPEPPTAPLQPQPQEATSEAKEPIVTLGQDILTGASLRAQLPLSQPLSWVQRQPLPLQAKPIPARLIPKSEGQSQSPSPTPADESPTGPWPLAPIAEASPAHPAPSKKASRAQRTTLPLPPRGAAPDASARPAPSPPTSPPQASPDRSSAETESFDQLSLPLASPPAAQAAETPQVQRPPEPPAVSPAAPPAEGLIQKAEEEESDAPAREPDLKQLAERILPLIKQMLVIERERRPCG